MSNRATTVGLLAALLSFPHAAFAQQGQHVAGRSALQKAVVSKAAADRENRAEIVNLLDRSDVRSIAAKLGLDVKRARTAVSQLDGERLADLASLARGARNDLAGGNSTVTLSVTTLLLLLILIVLIVD